ncbi:MAG: hypothetical protein IJP54_05540 [Synergistaceae bacterium]|nr:hypothetical protein [Synergistaceae bacterium]MBR0035117.1 hypothetical protein [Synergistaceae bacterium]
MKLCRNLLPVLAVTVLFISGCGGSSTSSEYSTSIIPGSWTAVSGEGTAEGAGGTFTMKLDHINAAFSELTESGDKWISLLSASEEWDMYSGDVLIKTLPLDFTDEAVVFSRAGSNKLTYTLLDPDPDYPDLRMAITITSETTADIHEQGSIMIDEEIYSYSYSYKFVKQ